LKWGEWEGGIGEGRGFRYCRSHRGAPKGRKGVGEIMRRGETGIYFAKRYKAGGGGWGVKWPLGSKQSIEPRVGSVRVEAT